MKRLNVFDTVIFDLDGTLLNTLEDLWLSANFALEKMGFPQRSLDEVRRFVGNGVAKLIERAVPDGTGPEAAAECLEAFRQRYNLHMEDRTQPYPGIVHLLAGLQDWGVNVGVVSNKYDQAVKRLCVKYFNGLIDAAVGEGAGLPPKPAPDSVLALAAAFRSKPERVLYVGDSAVDIQTAKNAGAASIGVAWGFRDEEELRNAGADYVVTRPYHIWSVLVSRNRGIAFEESWRRDYRGVVLHGAPYGMRDCVYYNQADKRWGALPFGETGTIQDDGCGPAVLAMAISSLTDNPVDLAQMACWADGKGYYCEGKGCYHRLIPEGARRFGLEAEAVGSHKEKLIQALKEKKMAAAVVRRGDFSGGGHFVLLRGITPEGKILVADPGSYPRSLAEWTVDTILENASDTAGSGGPFWLLWNPGQPGE